MAINKSTKMALFPLTPKLHQKLKSEAKILGLSMSDFIRYFLYNYFREKELAAGDEISHIEIDIAEVERRIMNLRQGVK